MAGAAGQGDACSGCWIDGTCYLDEATSQANPCQWCDAETDPLAWSNRDGASCNDEIDCNGQDTCQNGSCSVHSGTNTRVCNASGNVSEVGPCGSDLGEVEICAALNGACAEGVCLCQDGWTGDDCSQCVRYVHPDGDMSGASSGTSWSDPFGRLSRALSDDGGICEIWVAEGEYIAPSTSGFQVSAGQRVLGGFVRYQTDPDARDIAAHPTILSGDTGVSGDSSDNVDPAVTANDGAILDGLTVSNPEHTGILPTGNATLLDVTMQDCATGVDADPPSGSEITLTVTRSVFENAGLVLGRSMDEVHATITDSVFRQSDIYVATYDALVSDCDFENGAGLQITQYGYATIDSSRFSGGGISITQYGSATIDSCRFSGGGIVSGRFGSVSVNGSYFTDNAGLSCGEDNLCGVAGSVFENNSGTSIISSSFTGIDGCRFANNSATSVSIGTYGAAQIVNSVFHDNTAPAIDNRAQLGTSRVISSTFFRNAVGTTGSVINNTGTATEFLASILWGNGPTPISGQTTLLYNDIEGPSGTGTNISLDPLFVSTEAGAVDLRLQQSSPCIDRAPNDADIPETDYLGQARHDVGTVPNLNGSVADLGAYEWQPNIE